MPYRYRYHYRYQPTDKVQSEPERRAIFIVSGLVRGVFFAFMVAAFLLLLIRVL